MAPKTCVWLNGADRTYMEQACITPDMVGGPQSGYRIAKYRLYGGLGDGVDVVHVDNGVLSFDILPTRGMGIWKAKVGDLPIGWNSPVRGPVHPKYVPLSDPGGLGWLDGFDELLVRCGLESNGAPEFTPAGQLRYGLHGRIANKPAHQLGVRVDGETGEIAVTGVVDETRFHFFKLRMVTTITTRVGQTSLEIRDTVENLSGSATDIQMLYHINFGPPLLGPDAQVVAPVKTLVPRTPLAAAALPAWSRYPQPQADCQEQVYFFQLQGDVQQRTAVLLKDAQSARGVSVHFNTQQLPCFTLWKNPTAEADGYVTGLEPATNYPNPRSFEQQQGRVVSLPPGGKCVFDVQLQVHPTAATVERVQQQIEALQTIPATVHPQPQPGWCADA
ncbi:MAG: aldose 1-epimerase family protein [Pirellulaceae bacterium]